MGCSIARRQASSESDIVVPVRLRGAAIWVLLVSCAQNAELAFVPPPTWEPTNDLEADCATMCEQTIAHDCEMSPSLKRCSENCAESVTLTGPCRDVTQAYVRCLGEEGLNNCFDVPPGCDDAWLEWSMCSATGNGCGPVRCVTPDDPDGCACGAYCSSRLVEEHCVPLADGFNCTCSVDDQVVKNCFASATNCAFFSGCCADIVTSMPP
jgi:hypothetical protein